jgi:hypothetical protein
MTLKKLLAKATDKEKFKTIQNYIDFCSEYLEFIEDNLQAVIVSQNEHHYRFYQYKKDGNFNVSRPINSNLMYDAKGFEKAKKKFKRILKDTDTDTAELRGVLNNSVYTIQQSIGATLDALPATQSNTARKIVGDLFERLIRTILSEIGIDCSSGVVNIPVIVDGKREFDFSYQHDLIIKKGDELKAIGSVKTSSKDRIDKIFIDKFLYNKLTDKATPHFAIFLNDVQRKDGRTKGKFGVSATFLPGHFKGYTVKLNPLDGVYYCDIRPNMITEAILKDHIKTFDHLLFDDIWTMVR